MKKRTSRTVMLAGISAVLGTFVFHAYSQGTAPGGAPPAPPSVAVPQGSPRAVSDPAPSPTIEKKLTLWGLWKVGGWCMWPLGLVNIAAIAFTVYGYLIVREDKMLAAAVVPSLQEAISQLRIDEAMKLSLSKPSMLTNTLHAGLQRISDGLLDVTSLEKAMEEAAIEENQAGLRMIGYLSVCAQIAPMLGLLGTVSGMIKAFEKIGRGAMGKPELLATDIGEALVTTAYGLMIGIPAMLFYFYLKGRYTANVTKMGRLLGNLAHTLVTASRRAEAEAVPAAGSASPSGS